MNLKEGNNVGCGMFKTKLSIQTLDISREAYSNANATLEATSLNEHTSSLSENEFRSAFLFSKYCLKSIMK